MASFKEYLKQENESTLVLKRIISAISHFHINGARIDLNIGDVVKSNKYKKPALTERRLAVSIKEGANSIRYSLLF